LTRTLALLGSGPFAGLSNRPNPQGPQVLGGRSGQGFPQLPYYTLSALVCYWGYHVFCSLGFGLQQTFFSSIIWYQVIKNRIISQGANNRHQRIADYFLAFRPFPRPQRSCSLISSTIFSFFLSSFSSCSQEDPFFLSSAALNGHCVAFARTNRHSLLLCPFPFVLLFLPFPLVLHLYRQSQPRRSPDTRKRTFQFESLNWWLSFDIGMSWKLECRRSRFRQRFYLVSHNSQTWVGLRGLGKTLLLPKNWKRFCKGCSYAGGPRRYSLQHWRASAIMICRCDR
jgi:hypothetical protein